MRNGELAGPVWDLEDLARVLGVKPRSIHQSIARNRIARPRQRTARGALAWTESEATEVLRARIVDAAVRPQLWRRLEDSEQLMVLEHARRIAAAVLDASRR